MFRRASQWFALTAPTTFYLDAAKPPVPSDGDELALDQELRFGQA
ncbi:hypothetical protein [Rhizobium sp. P40RR-XXII]|nr:hypothetical protein [Rhizobium sp. P40RR-XXII]